MESESQNCWNQCHFLIVCDVFVLFCNLPAKIMFMQVSCGSSSDRIPAGIAKDIKVKFIESEINMTDWKKNNANFHDIVMTVSPSQP